MLLQTKFPFIFSFELISELIRYNVCLTNMKESHLKYLLVQSIKFKLNHETKFIVGSAVDCSGI